MIDRTSRNITVWQMKIYTPCYASGPLIATTLLDKPVQLVVQVRGLLLQLIFCLRHFQSLQAFPALLCPGGSPFPQPFWHVPGG